MRELKFRAWFEEKPIWCNQMFYSDEEPAGLGDWFSEVQIEQENVIIMQYTGLKDKHGKEIYEGNVVKVQDPIETHTSHNSIVYFDSEGARINYHPVHKKIDKCFVLRQLSDYLDIREQDNPTCEIIGNIYENPELLKE